MESNSVLPDKGTKHIKPSRREDLTGSSHVIGHDGRQCLLDLLKENKIKFKPFAYACIVTLTR